MSLAEELARRSAGLRFEEPLILRVAKLVQRTSGVGWPPAASGG